MGEKIANIQEVESRFSRFVLDHVGIARRWEVMDARPLMPFDFIMFSRIGEGTVSEDLSGITQASNYGMEIFMKRTKEEREEGQRVASSVLIDLQPNDMEILDPYFRLQRIVPDYTGEQASYATTADKLLDELVELETAGLFVAAGHRTFPDDPRHHLH